MKIKIEIPGLDEVEALIQKHMELMGEVRKNLNKLYSICGGIEAEINQPTAAIAD